MARKQRPPNIFGDIYCAPEDGRWERRREKIKRITTHVQNAFRSVLEKAGFVCICAPADNPERGMIIFDDDVRFTLTTHPMVDRSRDHRTTVKVYNSLRMEDQGPFAGFGSDRGKPFFSWDSLKEPRPHKAALLLVKKLKMNPVHEIMDC